MQKNLGTCFQKTLVHQNSMNIPVLAFWIYISKVHDETDVLLKGESTRNKNLRVSFTLYHLFFLFFLLLEKKEF